jgi:hypothetical protein
VLVVEDWHYAGRGYLDLATAAAVTSAVLARTRTAPITTVDLQVSTSNRGTSW